MCGVPRRLGCHHCRNIDFETEEEIASGIYEHDKDGVDKSGMKRTFKLFGFQDQSKES